MAEVLRERDTEPTDLIGAGPQETGPVGEVEDAASDTAAPGTCTEAAGPDADSQPDRAGTIVMTEVELAREICEMVRVNSRVSGKTPLDPPELRRHERLQEIRSLVTVAREKGGSAVGSLDTAGALSIS